MRSTMMGLVLICGAAGAATLPNPQATVVPMTVRAVGVYQGSPVVLLEDAAQEQRLTIGIGEQEAAAIDMRLHGSKTPRPLTHELLERTLVALGAHVERVEVVDLRDGVYYGRLTLRDKAGQLRAIDARPSDCIALAVGAGLQIFVAKSVLAEASIAVKP
jgi:bifunctional DNase/RNase